ncbi:hypothetical protein F5878DRAFT_656238 [Lentinula raphanica]|uniref:Uncharacterized protein n=1 Tax=Lentinula raphanica TaxID=153919 RepID=A0AA38UJG2_9AGAR|nr:hypothetical protein F5878DRAFT_656238 [Lentinula raphanica]
MAKSKAGKTAQVAGASATGKKGRTRTKATAKKSTGAPAPLRSFGGGGLSRSPSTNSLLDPPQATGTEELEDTLLNGTLTPLPMEEDSEDSPRRSSRLKSQSARAVSQTAPSPTSAAVPALAPAPAPDKTPADIEMLDPVSESEHNFCAGCHDGGKLLRCEGEALFEDASAPICGRYMCFGLPGSHRCLELTEAAIQVGIKDKEIAFVCPACWKFKYQHSERSMPYEGFFRRDQPAIGVPNMLHRVHIVKQSLSTLDLVPTAVVAITLVGMAHEPYEGTVVDLESYYRACSAPLLKFEIFFDFSTLSTMAAYNTKIAKLIDSLEKHGIKRVIVFITTHSTPDTGLLHFMPNDQGAAPVSETIKRLINAELTQFLQSEDIHASLFMLACGGAFMRKKDFKVFMRLVQTPIVKVQRMGAHLQIPVGDPNAFAGEWKVLDYVWPEEKGEDHIEHF